jgi:hypothetical protein
MGAIQNAGVSFNQKVFRWFNISPRISATMSSFDAAMDTAATDTIRKVTVLYDTVNAIPDIIIDTTRHLIDTLVDTLNNDSSYIMQWDSINTYPYYDTTYRWTHVPDWNAGISMSTELFGIFPVRVLNFLGFRHTLRPSVGYRFVPVHDLDKQFVPVVSYARPRDKRQQVIDFSVDNLFEGKILKKSKRKGRDGKDEKGEEKKFTMFSAGARTSYDFEKETTPWSDLSVSARTSFKFVSLSYSSVFWLYDIDSSLSSPLLRTFTVGVTPRMISLRGSFWGGDLLVFENVNPEDPIKYAQAGQQQWQFSLTPSYSFTRSRVNQRAEFEEQKRYRLSASARIQFTRNWSMSWGSSYDFVRNRFIGHSLDFYCDLECWEMKFNWRPSGVIPGFYFIVNIKKLPEIKWEKRD